MNIDIEASASANLVEQVLRVRHGPAAAAERLATLEEILAGPGDTAFLASVGGAQVGCLIVHQRRASSVLLHALEVIADEDRDKAAGRLLAEAMDRCRATTPDVLFVAVVDKGDEWASAQYRILGFRDHTLVHLGLRILINDERRPIGNGARRHPRRAG